MKKFLYYKHLKRMVERDENLKNDDLFKEIIDEKVEDEQKELDKLKKKKKKSSKAKI